MGVVLNASALIHMPPHESPSWGYEVRTLRFPRGDFTIGGNNMRGVVCTREESYIPASAEDGSAVLWVPYEAKVIGEEYSNKRNIILVRIPPTVKVIGSYAFEDCYELASVALAGGVREIREEAFYDLNLTSIAIPGSVDSVGKYAFYDAEIATLELAEGIVSIEDYTFGYTSIKRVIIPSSVKYFGTCLRCSCFCVRSITTIYRYIMREMQCAIMPVMESSP